MKMLEIKHASPLVSFAADAVTTEVVGAAVVGAENVTTGVVVVPSAEEVSTSVLETTALVAETSTELVCVPLEPVVVTVAVATAVPSE